MRIAMPMTDQVQPLNYCAHAIEDLRTFAGSLRGVAPQSAHVVGRLIDMLRDSVTFLLPNCCELLDPDDMRQGCSWPLALDHLSVNQLSTA